MEDDEGLQLLLRLSLEREGYAVDSASDGEEGLHKVTQNNYDLIIVDYHMPVYDGLAVLKQLVQLPDVPPTVMLTGAGNEKIAVDALKYGASDYIVKDVDNGYLRLLPSVIEQALYKRQLISEKKEREQQFRWLVDNSPDAIVIHESGTIEFANPAFVKLLNAPSRDSLIGKSLLTFLKGNSPQHGMEHLSNPSHTESAQWVEMTCATFDDRATDVETCSISLTHDDPPKLQTIIRDISARKEQERHIRNLALSDHLTGLQNRVLFLDALKEYLSADTDEFIAAVLFLDLDRFKEVNDTLGHATGDVLLKGVAKRLKACVREHDSVARIGGDEFTILLKKLKSDKDAATAAQRIIDSLSRPFIIHSRTCTIGVSIGVSLYPKDGDNPETLINKADTAMYHIKGTRRNHYGFFSDSL